MSSGVYPGAVIWAPGALHYYESLSSLAAKYALYNLCQPQGLIERLQQMRRRRERRGRRGRCAPGSPQRSSLNDFDWSPSVLRRLHALLDEPLDRIASMAIHGVLDSPLVAFRGRVCPECIAAGFHSWMHTIEGIDTCFIHHSPLGVHIKPTQSEWQSHLSLAASLRDYWRRHYRMDLAGLRIIGGVLSLRPDPQVEQLRFALQHRYARTARGTLTFHNAVEDGDGEGARRRWRSSCRAHACCADAAHLKLFETLGKVDPPKQELKNWIIACDRRERDAILALDTPVLAQLVAVRQLYGLWTRRSASLPSISGAAAGVKDHQACVEKLQADFDSTHAKYFPVLVDIRILLFPALTASIFHWISCPALIAMDLLRAAALPVELIARRAYGASQPASDQHCGRTLPAAQLDQLRVLGLVDRVSMTTWCPIWPWVSYESDELLAPWSCTGLPERHPAYGYPVSSPIEVPTGALGRLCDLLITQRLALMQTEVTDFLHTSLSDRYIRMISAESTWRSLLAPYAWLSQCALSAAHGGVQLTRNSYWPHAAQVDLSPAPCVRSSYRMRRDDESPEGVVDALVAQCDKRDRSVDWRRFLRSIGVEYWRTSLDAWGNPQPAYWC